MNSLKLRAQVEMIAATAVFAAAIVVLPGGMAQSNPLPKQVRQPTPAKVVAEHMAAFSACDWKRLMAQFPDNVEFFAPNGVTVRGRQAVGEMFAKVVKPPAQGGTCCLLYTSRCV